MVDFGAIADGTTDCIDAVIRMFKWSQRVLPSAGIRFTAGEFSLSGFDLAEVLGSDREINRFKISGAPVNFGYFPTTTLKFNWGPKPRKTHFFSVRARYVEISGFVVKGMSSDSGEDGGTAFNNVGFFTNSIIGGQFLRVSSMEFRYLGGRALELIDTLDCKIDQFYSRGCQGSIVYARWSDREKAPGIIRPRLNSPTLICSAAPDSRYSICRAVRNRLFVMAGSSTPNSPAISPMVSGRLKGW